MPEKEQEQDALNTPEGQTPVGGDQIGSLPDWAQRIIRETRTEAKERRLALERIEAERQQERDTRLAEEKQWQELAESRAKELEVLKPYKDRVSEIESALRDTVKARIDRLPEDMRPMVPEYEDARKTLAWLDANEAKLARPAAPATDAGARGDPGKEITLTPGQQSAARAAGITDAQYIEALLKMQPKG